MLLPSPAMLLFLCFLGIEALVVLMLVMPMPNNTVRGKVLDVALSVWNKPKVQYGCWGAVTLCGLYFWDSVSRLATAPIWTLSCEQRELLFVTERNAYATAMAVILFLVLRRLLDIQAQLYSMRLVVKQVEKQQTKQLEAKSE